MFEENEECPKCHSTTVRHDRVKGNVKCFGCGYVVETHYQTFEQEVNNYENDPDQVNKMRGLVQDGRDFKIKIGKDIIDEQRKKKKGDEDNSKKALKNLQNWCDSLLFDKNEIFQITRYYYILQNIDGGSSATGNLPQAQQKETGINILNRRVVIAIYIYARLLKLHEYEPIFELEKLCDRFCVPFKEVSLLIQKIKKISFEDREKIIDILIDKVDIVSLAEEYSDKAGLSENDKKGYLELCQQIKEQEISNGEQLQTKVAAALYLVFQLSQNPGTHAKTLKDASTYSQKSEGTIKKFFDVVILSHLPKLLDAIKYQQYNWKSYSDLKKNSN